MALVRALVIAGGGAGAAAVSGLSGPGGGAGGVIHETSFQLNAGTYAVTVGAGGVESNGQNSVLSTLIAIGGGYNGAAGGSGSGARAPLYIGTVLGGAGTPGQGNQGAQSITYSNPSPPPATFYSAGQGGSLGSPYNIGVTNDITGATVNYAGGGEPGVITTQNSTGGGGPGGGGVSSLNGGGNGAANKGAGGGGGSTGPGVISGLGGNGGSGVVIVRYLTTDYQSGSGGNVTIDGLYTVRTFTSSGTLTLVGNPGIDARNESFTSNWGNTNIGNAFTNDLLNDASFSPGDVIATIVTPATPVSGNPVPVLNTTTGVISIPDYTYPGVYTIVYQICDALNPGTCDQATITVTVTSPPVTANNITFVDKNGTNGNANIGNALANDMINGIAVDPTKFTITVITPAVGTFVPVLNTTTGVVSSPVGTTGGTYTIVYQICETNNLSNCSQATITIKVEDKLTKNIQVLVVAGGGAGGGDTGGGTGNGYFGGGGGGGGVVYNASYLIKLGSYNVVVGAGGTGVATFASRRGGDSIFDTIKAWGGAGGNPSDGSGGGCGSGGGGYGYLGGLALPKSPLTAQGYKGGDGRTGSGGIGSNNPQTAGGGGGAGAVGQNGLITKGGDGGIGVQNSISGVATYYAGGGGAGADNYRGPAVAGTGGLGGGGNGGNSGTVSGTPAKATGTDGAPNTGGGGGATNGWTFPSGNGGSGIVIIRYPTNSMTATGGVITTDGADTIHTFLTSGVFTASALENYVECLVIGGGGGGGRAYGGGGGAGGFVRSAAIVKNNEIYPVVVGTGGQGGQAVNPTWGSNGLDSSFAEITATGGGGGGGGNQNSSPLANASGRNGGSGGGAAVWGTNYTAVPGTGNTPAKTNRQGYNGGQPPVSGSGTGGGGASEMPGTGFNYIGYGGAGLPSDISGTSVTYCGGGGGGGSANNGGTGGGGAGTSGVGSNGTANTGGGGGGGGATSNGGNGGSGIVIIRYLTANFGNCTGGVKTTNGDYTIHTFTASGNFVPEVINQMSSNSNFLGLMD